MVWKVRTSLLDADARLLSHVSSKKFDSSLLPANSTFYSVQDNPSQGKCLTLNPSLELLFEKVPSGSRLVSINLRESEILESTFRSLSETLSHSMWVLSALLGFIKLQGFVLKDPALFVQLVSSISKSMAHQANIAASWTTFICHKRRQLLLSHLPAYFPDTHKKVLLSVPSALSSSLFKEDDVKYLLDIAQKMF